MAGWLAGLWSRGAMAAPRHRAPACSCFLVLYLLMYLLCTPGRPWNSVTVLCLHVRLPCSFDELVITSNFSFERSVRNCSVDWAEPRWNYRTRGSQKLSGSLLSGYFRLNSQVSFWQEQEKSARWVIRVCRDGSAGKGACCCFTGPGFGSQHPHGGLQLSNSSSRGSNSFLLVSITTAHMCTDKSRHTHTYKINI